MTSNLGIFGSRLMVIAAHPDDETIGCGGTLAQLTDLGCHVKVVFLAEGESSRSVDDSDSNLSERIERRESQAMQALAHLGISDVSFLRFPDNRIDSIPLLDIVRALEIEISLFHPESVLTHSFSDLNIDHELALRSTLTATRPSSRQTVRLVASFEILSSTALAFNSKQQFRPNLFVEISNAMQRKLLALREYGAEIPESHHPRSVQALSNKARAWGDFAGMKEAEAFEIHRLFV